jgi:hypothetical protein
LTASIQKPVLNDVLTDASPAGARCSLHEVAFVTAP